MKIASSTFAIAPEGPLVFGIPVDFVLFGLTLLGVALFHRRTLGVALAGFVTIAIYKIVFTGFKSGPGVMGFLSHVGHEWVILANLLCLLMAFALLSRHFEKSHLPLVLPKYLPHDWKGGFVLLVMIWILSSFLDNIAGALIGGAMAHQLFRAKVHIGYLAAIVAASNAGGAWSVLGDTTTTMMWIAGILPARCPGDHRFDGGVVYFRHPSGHSTTQTLAHLAGCSGAYPCRLDACRHRRADSCARDRDQRGGEPEVARAG